MGSGDACGFDMVWKETMEGLLVRVLYHIFYHDKPLQAQLGVMEVPEAHEQHTFW